MIDLHSHILPDLDDGAATLAEALALGRMAAADGIRTIAATPHSPASIASRHYGPALIQEQVAALNTALAAEAPCSADEAAEALQRAGGWLRSEVAQAITRKRVPSLLFRIVPAIGKEGQNARLAARLTGWRIDIRSDAVPASRAEPNPDAAHRAVHDR